MTGNKTTGHFRAGVRGGASCSRTPTDSGPNTSPLYEACYIGVLLACFLYSPRLYFNSDVLVLSLLVPWRSTKISRDGGCVSKLSK